MMMMMRVWIAIFFVLGVCVVHAQEEKPEPPEDPARRARIERWVEELGASDFDTREKAFANLLEAADDAVYALIPAAGQDENLEKSDRARELLEKIEWAPPEERKEIRRLIDLLTTSRKADEWNAALEKLKTLGKRARIEFEKIAVTVEGEVAISVTPESEVVERGKPVSYEVTMENRGKTPFWIEPGRLRSLLLPAAFFGPTRGTDWLVQGQAMTAGGYARVIDGKMVTFPAKSSEEGTAPYVYLEPGESFSFSATHDGQETDWVGPVEIRATYDPTPFGVLWVAAGGNVARRVPGGIQKGGEEPAGPWPDILPLQQRTRQVLPEVLLASSKVILVPPKVPEGDEPTVNGLSLTLTEPAGKPEGAQEGRKVLTWRNKSASPITVPAWDQGERYGLWFVLFDGEGRFLRGGGIEGPPPGEEREWTVLEPGASISIEVEIPLSAEEGERRIRIAAGSSSENALHLPPGALSNQNVRFLRAGGGKAAPNRRASEDRTGAQMQERSSWKGILHSNVLKISAAAEE